MTASDLDRALRASRAALRRHERDAVKSIGDAYRVAVSSFRDDLRAVQSLIAAQRATGDASPGALLREARVRALLDQVERAGETIARATASAMQRGGTAVIAQAEGDLRQIILAGMGPGPGGLSLSFATLPHESLSQLLDSFGPNSPVIRLLDDFAGTARLRVQNELIAGLARGDTPRVISRKLAKILGGQRKRAELICIESIFGAHSRATRATADANRRLLRGWRRYEAMDRRTCVLCAALDGQEYDFDTAFLRHPRCRGRQVFIVRKGLGFDGGPAVTPGPARFAGYPAELQRRLLGPGAFDAYRAGLVELIDFVQRTRHPVWGPGIRRRSLPEAIEAAERRRRHRAA